MKKIILFALPLLILSSCRQKLNPDDAIAIVMSGEQDRLPLILQRFVKVENITLDSMRLLTKDEPMEGFLYTTWTVKKRKLNKWTWEYENYTETKPIIIKVDSIQKSKDRKDYIVWKTDWVQAYWDAD